MKKYSIGLDIGTTSVGYAVIDNATNKVLKKSVNRQGKKKSISLWGSRLFDEAVSAADRRGKRGQRKRYDRRRSRIKKLRYIFRDEMNKVDKNFFDKLDESFYKEDDLENKKHQLNDEDKKLLKKYQKNYKTIYHLRDELINNPEKKDIRLVYLAIHHILKYRGNFNYPGKASNFKVENIDTFSRLKKLIQEYAEVLENFNFDLDEVSLNELNDTFYDIVKADRNKKITKILQDKAPKDFSKEFAKALSGYKFDASKLYDIEVENKDDLKFSFESQTFDEDVQKKNDILGDKLDLLLELKSLYDSITLKNMFGEYNAKNISDLKKKIYDKHGKDLKKIKKIFKGNRESFNKLFFSSKCTYIKYVRNNIEYQDLIKDLDNEAKKLPEIRKQEYDKLKAEMDKGTFLPRVTSTNNGNYPFQLNEVELIDIIDNQKKYYPFLGRMTDGETYDIVKILEFKIPYYVGPLNDATSDKNVKNENAWLIRNKGMENVRITPFNFDEVVNKDATAEEFIKRMISHCTYLTDEYALPNNSILYSKFKVINELKQITYTVGEKVNHLSSEDIVYVYKNLFLKKRNITEKVFESFLRSENILQEDLQYDIKGYSANKKFANSMSSFIDFFEDGTGIFENTNYTPDDAEKIIEWVTIFEDKNILKRKVKQEYPDLNDKQVNMILKLNYKGWGRLSKKLINGILSDSNSEMPNKTIIELMIETKENFMQILNNKNYKFMDTINEINGEDVSDKLDYSVVEDLPTSPANKRGIWQTLKIIDELVTNLGIENLDSIYLEMAREKGKKQRTESRKNKLTRLLTANKELLKQLNPLEEKQINERVYLYFVQEGKSLYSGRPINFEDLGNKDLYEVDHIIPQSLIKDDSMDNKALVYREENQEKKNNPVLKEAWRKSQIVWWGKLKDRKLISAKKYKSLTRDKMTDKELQGFINRQLVETRQISIHVANILKKIYGKNKNISFINAGISHNYRECFELFKYRDLNDYHHAKDAYLAVVLGKYKDKLLNKKKISLLDFKEITDQMIKNKDYKKLRYGYIINSLNHEFMVVENKTGRVLDVDVLNKTIKEQMSHNDIIVTKKTEIRTGQLFDETKYGAGVKKNAIKLKDNISTEYGGYSSLKPAYACLIKYTKKGKEEQRLVGMPIMYMNSSKLVQIDYLKSLLKLKPEDNLKILKDKIPFNSVFDWNGQICCLVGATDTIEVCNAKEFYFDSKSEEKWKYTLNRLFNNKKNIDDINYSRELSEVIKYVYNKINDEYKLYANLREEFKKNMCLDDLNELSISTKEQILKEIFNLLKAFNSKNANLKFLDELYKDDKHSSAFGKKHGRTISHAKIINTSPAGLKENIYEF